LARRRAEGDVEVDQLTPAVRAEQHTVEGAERQRLDGEQGSRAI